MTEQIQTIFNKIAPVYDELNDKLSLGQHRIWKQMTIKWTQVQPGNIGLDLCCGSGDLTFLLARKITNSGQTYGVDFSCNLLEMAKKRCKDYYPQPQINWLEADVLNLPFDNNYCHVVTMGYGLRNVQNIPLCLQEIYRVLKPGGKAAILDFHRPSNQYIRNIQQWYLDNCVVPLATQMGLKEEYAYISPSLDRFPRGSEQKKIAQEIGFQEVTHYPLANGMMGVLVVRK
ncbi:bifunctional demethylmenaquinone methyltransferase/2-methoxy-6-polyprenyl-1,4-benzoquinol methylase UbiE [Anabaena sp. FACHB-1237]|uniref:bifunctional demethylmenaquinone methyltransferase/2-methoxy-6-polyprenyl-1,4-benzoquinol methylase UbiE n=1 Tax=Anabaena sp. FACHB-1237 TaxID=2692769 RepID=UPI001681AAC2|nr:bifunctional demethylmenaquinone methyltransferase/2-methoxy-6-polyprenyl-1,4-benzoquinol methylase UbiE [Anabaena sp. FACHB-1237]MBD2138428.1 bifunctional demethylmenaquinone methyltransferase/2-methoxy-6-polyprenyl-1,4-benzoquinol methylase UbiE [Anabaena sp. FACHB-1237]